MKLLAWILFCLVDVPVCAWRVLRFNLVPCRCPKCKKEWMGLRILQMPSEIWKCDKRTPDFPFDYLVCDNPACSGHVNLDWRP